MPKKRNSEDVALKFAKAIAELPKVDLGDYYMVGTHHSEIGERMGLCTRTATRYLNQLLKDNYITKGKDKADVLRPRSEEESKSGQSGVNYLFTKNGFIAQTLSNKTLGLKNNVMKPEKLSTSFEYFLSGCFPIQFPKYVGKFYHDPNKKFKRTLKERIEYKEVMTKREQRLYELNSELGIAGSSMADVIRVIDKADNLIIKSNTRGNIEYYHPKDIKGAYLLSRMWDLFIIDMMDRDSRLKDPEWTEDKLNEDYSTMPTRFLGTGRLTVYLHLADYLIANKIDPVAYMEPAINWWFNSFNQKDSSGEYIPGQRKIRMLYPNYLLGDKAKQQYYTECKYTEEHMPELFNRFENGKKVRREKRTLMNKNPEMQMLGTAWDYLIKGINRYDEIQNQVKDMVKSDSSGSDERGSLLSWFDRFQDKLEGTPDLKKFVTEQVYFRCNTEGYMPDYVTAIGSSVYTTPFAKNLFKLHDMHFIERDSTPDDEYALFYKTLFPSGKSNMYCSHVDYAYRHYFRAIDDMSYNRRLYRFSANCTLSSLITGSYVETRHAFALTKTPEAPIYDQIKQVGDLPLDKELLVDLSVIHPVEKARKEEERKNDPLFKSLYAAQERYEKKIIEQENRRKRQNAESRRKMREQDEKKYAHINAIEQNQIDNTEDPALKIHLEEEATMRAILKDTSGLSY